jgi:hypothetical protein
VTVVGDYFDLEPLTMRGPIIRYETIVLVKPMVEEVIELSGVDGITAESCSCHHAREGV